MSENQGHTVPIKYDPATGRITITQFEISNPEILGEAHHWSSGQRGAAVDDEQLAAADLSPFINAAIATGVKAIAVAAGSTEVASNQRLIAELGDRAEESSQRAAERIGHAAEVTEKAARISGEETRKVVSETAEKMRTDMRTALIETVTDLRREIVALTGEDAPVAAAAKAAVAKAGEELQSRLDKRMDETVTGITQKFDHRDPTTPIGHLVSTLRTEQKAVVDEVGKQHAEVLDRLDKIQTNIVVAAAAAEATAKATAASTLKGLPYQDAVQAVVSGHAAALGDEYIDTSATTGQISACKKGDGVLTVPDQPGAPDGVARIVLEMTNSVARRDWVKYLDECERNRGASASLGVVRTSDQVPGGGLVRIFGSRRMIVAFDPETDDPGLLQSVVLLLRAQACLASARSSGAQARTAEEKLVQATELLDKLPDLQRVATTTRSNADKLVNGLGSLHTTLARLLGEAMTALREATADGYTESASAA